MRRRLIKNVNYEDHRVAASRRDRTGQCQAEPTNSDCFPSVPSADLSEEYEIIDFSALSEAASGPDTANFSTFGERIALLGCVYGRIELAHSYLRFIVERDSNGRAKQLSRSAATDTHSSNDKHPRAVYAELSRDYCWQLSDIHQVHFRRYMMRSSALEIFFRDRTSVLLNFATKKTLMQLVWKLTSLPAVNCQLALSDIRPPPVLLRRLKLTEHWQRGELSNFDYLMGLNTVAGRSYNDLSQYPVFPWVIRDYTSKWLDLTNSKTFRDLSRPMGALNEKRLKHFIERYESFEDPSGRIKKFHYGTHYSSAASVAYYLVRMEPFASVHVSLQSGKFDHADRQFHSIADTWNSCVTSSGDVKELIPEFYYLPEFLVNHNSLSLGQKQDGTCLGDVQLPPWADTPEEFIRINRQALESEYVSANLHKWVDLIFGYKQRGVEAVKAYNVFYYLTYEGAVNIDAVQDPVERASIESQINYFGQTPTQLFATPHPPRQ
ncbi:BEACH domain-containing protein, partial [Coemansia mojavensis]